MKLAITDFLESCFLSWAVKLLTEVKISLYPRYRCMHKGYIKNVFSLCIRLCQWAVITRQRSGNVQNAHACRLSLSYSDSFQSIQVIPGQKVRCGYVFRVSSHITLMNGSKHKWLPQHILIFGRKKRKSSTLSINNFGGDIKISVYFLWKMWFMCISSSDFEYSRV
jgi:hypothetical protein